MRGEFRKVEGLKVEDPKVEGLKVEAIGCLRGRKRRRRSDPSPGDLVRSQHLGAVVGRQQQEQQEQQEQSHGGRRVPGVRRRRRRAGQEEEEEEEEEEVPGDMKLKQRVVLLATGLLLLAVAKIFLLDGSEGTEASRRDLQAYRKIFLLDGSEGTEASRRDLQAYRKMEAGLLLSRAARLTNTLQSPWEVAAQWAGPREVYPEDAPELAAVLTALSTARVERADVGYKGTQLKALLLLDGGQKVVFKPKRYNRDYVVEGEPYAGYDRHNAEVAAFHLDRILGFRRAPLVVGRFVNLRSEIKPVATDQLLNTFLMQGNNTCFYGKCYYCRESEPACAVGDVMEGAVTLWLPDVWPLQKHRHPWGRTYREGKLARWEYDESYCDAVKKMPPYDAGPRLLDLIDTAMFDYLIGNADRHHYESFQDDGGASMLILLDNAKSFGNPAADERSILAPLYQCCMVRVSTWNRLNLLRGGALSAALRQALTFDPIQPVLAEPHLAALDRRLAGIMATVKQVRVSTWNRLNLLRGGALSAALRQALTFDPIQPVLAEPHLAALDRRLAGIMATVKQCVESQGADNTLIEDRMNLPHP
ncbi:hypothetical protein CRUP_031397 [Coryphaenoides rupestris]|nr:hypothetical protein CRUP_031397 [Coryphaenoides rupestris]